MDQLPVSLLAWRILRPHKDPEWYKPWETLRSFFLEHGYSLFRARSEGLYSTPDGTPSPASDSFGLYGDRESNFHSQMQCASLVCAARDRKNRDVVIKVVAKGDEGRNELDTLQLLNSEPLRSDPDNFTVPVLEFLSYSDWQFAVMPFYDVCDCSPFIRALECLDFAEQVLAALAFLHRNHIAHLDMAHDNILMNHHGKIPGDLSQKVWPPPEFRSTFPVRYYLMDFGCSAHFPPNLHSNGRLVKPITNRRKQIAPEMYGSQDYDAFAADIYLTARLFYAFFMTVVPDIPGFVELLQDMSSFKPSFRISAAEALSQLRALRSKTPEQVLSEVREIEFSGYHPIPRGILRTIFELLVAGQVKLASQYIRDHIKKWSQRDAKKIDRGC